MKLGSNSIIINIVTKVSDVDIRVPVNSFLPLLVMITLIDDDIIITLRIIVNSIVNSILPPYCIYIIIVINKDIISLENTNIFIGETQPCG